MSDKELTVGILGGMGPAATSHFFNLIIDQSNADIDQDHLRIVLDNNPKIPDRTEYLLNDGANPLPLLLETAKNVERLGADILTIPCNTSHAFLKEIRSSVNIDVLDMIKITIDELEQRPTIEDVGLLATTGTVETKIYQNRIYGHNINLKLPSEMGQENIMAAIYGDAGIKAGYRDRPKEILLETINSNFADIDALIAGCTEIPLVLSNEKIGAPIIDPLEILARVVTNRAKSE